MQRKFQRAALVAAVAGIGLISGAQSALAQNTPVAIDDVMYGLNRSAAAETVQQVRGNPIGSKTTSTWSQGFIQSIQLDNYDGFRHAMEWYDDRDQTGLASATPIDVAGATQVDEQLDRTTGELAGRVQEDESADPIAGAWVGESDRFHRTKGQGVFAPAGHLFHRQTPLEIATAFKLLLRYLLGSQDLIH